MRREYGPARRARGRYVCFVDAKDVVPPAAQRALLEKRSKLSDIATRQMLIRGARENNLKNVSLDIRMLICCHGSMQSQQQGKTLLLG